MKFTISCLLILKMLNSKFGQDWPSSFSSPEPKAEVSFSDQDLSVVVVVVVNFSQNHWTNFNQIWHKAFLNNVDSKLFK